MSLAGPLIGLLSDGTDGIGFTVVTLIGCHVLDAAVAMLSVVPVNKGSVYKLRR
jgi:hypothetical protein